MCRLECRFSVESGIAQTLIHLYVLMLTHRWSMDDIDTWLFFPHLFVSCWLLPRFFLYYLSWTNLPLFCTSNPHIIPLPYCYLFFAIISSIVLVPSLYSIFFIIATPLYLYPYHLYLIFLLFVSRFFSTVIRVVSGGCGMTLWGNRSLPSSLETSTALPRSTEVTTGCLPFASSSLSTYLLY